MPQLYYPKANTTAQRFDDNYPGTTFTAPLKRCVWHTTETGTWPGYSGGASAPTLTVMPDFTNRKAVWRQHFPTNMSARALRNLSGGVETNRDECVQVEIIGTCDPSAHAQYPGRLYTPEAPEWFLEQLGDFVAWLKVEWGVPLDYMPLWQSYPASYGSTANRMTNSEWVAFRGHCGHQHVPENTHGDPGRIDMSAVIAAAQVTLDPPTPPTTPPPGEEDDMAFLANDGEKWWLVMPPVKIYLSSGALVAELRDVAKIPSRGQLSGSALSCFATTSVSNVGNLFVLTYDRLTQVLTNTADIEGAVAGVGVSLSSLDDAVTNVDADVSNVRTVVDEIKDILTSPAPSGL